VRRADNLTTFICRLFRNSGSLNLLEPSRPVQACNGIALPLPPTLRILIGSWGQKCLPKHTNNTLASKFDKIILVVNYSIHITCLAINPSQWPCGLRSGSAAARLLGLWVRIPPGTWMSVCCECCVLSGRGLCDGLITRTEESYRVWSWSLGKMRRPRPPRGCRAIGGGGGTPQLRN
jgi:hypothetical protein